MSKLVAMVRYTGYLITMIRLALPILLFTGLTISSCSSVRRIYMPIPSQTLLSSGPVKVQVLSSMQIHGRRFSLISLSLRVYNTDSVHPAVFPVSSLQLAGPVPSYTNKIAYLQSSQSSTPFRFDTTRVAPSKHANIAADFIFDHGFKNKKHRHAPFADSLTVSINRQVGKVVLFPRGER